MGSEAVIDYPDLTHNEEVSIAPGLGRKSAPKGLFLERRSIHSENTKRLLRCWTIDALTCRHTKILCRKQAKIRVLKSGPGGDGVSKLGSVLGGRQVFLP
jgi:hypothetical protein